MELRATVLEQNEKSNCNEVVDARYEVVVELNEASLALIGGGCGEVIVG